MGRFVTGILLMLFLAGGVMAQQTFPPRDGAMDLTPPDFKVEETGVWETSPRSTDFPFDELVYSWNARLPRGQGFRLYLELDFDEGETSPWMYAGFWGSAKPREEDIVTTFSHGGIKYDHLKLKKKAGAVRFRIVDEGGDPLTVRPSLHVVYTDNSPETEAMASPSDKKLMFPILDLPLRKQYDSSGEYVKNTCQSAALASAMEYFGKEIRHEDIVKRVHDPEYDLMGIWPRVTAAASHFGFTAYIDRFRSWEDVRKAVTENKVILASITMPEEGDYIAPPYSRMGGHIVAVNGVTDDGRVVVTDSALAKSGRGYQCQWLKLDFGKIWMKNKGGIGLVICPPDNAEMKLVKDLPPFPTRKRAERSEKK